MYESLFVLDGDGRVLTGTRDEQLEEWARPLTQGDVPFDGVLVSPLRKSAVLGRPTLLLLRPVPPPGTSDRRGRAIGYFVERFDLREMESMLGEDATDLAPAPWLLDAEGRILARSGKVVDDPGAKPFPIPAGRRRVRRRAGRGCGGDGADAPRARLDRVRPAQPRRPVPGAARGHRAPARAPSRPSTNRAAGSSSRGRPPPS